MDAAAVQTFMEGIAAQQAATAALAQQQQQQQQQLDGTPLQRDT